MAKLGMHTFLIISTFMTMIIAFQDDDIYKHKTLHHRSERFKRAKQDKDHHVICTVEGINVMRTGPSLLKRKNEKWRLGSAESNIFKPNIGTWTHTSSFSDPQKWKLQTPSGSSADGRDCNPPADMTSDGATDGFYHCDLLYNDKKPKFCIQDFRNTFTYGFFIEIDDVSPLLDAKEILKWDNWYEHSPLGGNMTSPSRKTMVMRSNSREAALVVKCSAPAEGDCKQVGYPNYECKSMVLVTHESSSILDGIWNYKRTGKTVTREEMVISLLLLRLTSAIYFMHVSDSDWFPDGFDFHTMRAYTINSDKDYSLLRVIDTIDVVYVVFRGTRATVKEDIFVDLDLFPKSFYGKKVHGGFVTRLTQLEKEADKTANSESVNWKENVLIDKIRNLSNDWSRPVVFTGHSLGAALATLLAYKCYMEWGMRNFRLITFASPRVFYEKPDFCDGTVNWLNEGTVDKCIRWVNYHDPVATVPANWHAEHVGRNLYIYHPKTGWELSEWGKQKKKGKNGTIEETWDLDMDPAFSVNPKAHGTNAYYNRMVAAAKEIFEGFEDPWGCLYANKNTDSKKF